MAADHQEVDMSGEPVGIALGMDDTLWVTVATADGAVVRGLAPDRATVINEFPGPARWGHNHNRVRIASDGTIWADTGNALEHRAADGTRVGEIDIGREADEDAVFVVLDDGILVARFRRYERDFDPIVLRVDFDGQMRWSTSLDPGWSPGGRPRDWGPVQRTEPLLVSGDVVVVTAEEESRGIGNSTFLDLASGRIRAQTLAAPHGGQVIVGHERFLIGYQGYGAFNLDAVDGDGATTMRWDRHAWTCVDQSGSIRGVDIENRLPSQMHVTTFGPNGEVTIGPHLEGWRTSYPALSDEGWLCFWREGMGLLGVLPEMVSDTLWSDSRRMDWVATTRTLIDRSGAVIVGIRPPYWTGSNPVAIGQWEDRARSSARLLLVQPGIGGLAHGPWPCGGGNGRANPVWR